MRLRIKNFNILGFHSKIRLLGGDSQKNDIEGGGLPKKGGLGRFADLRRGLARKRAGDTPMHTMSQVSQRSLFHAIFTQGYQVTKFFAKYVLF